MLRREFISTSAAATLALLLGIRPAAAARSGYGKVLILIELQGGNDGLNTVIPYLDPAYYSLRPQLAIARDAVLPLDERGGLHPALQPLLSLWQGRELALIQGVGYPEANLSHFRSIEIWETASRSNEYLREGWLARAFRAAPVPPQFAADAVVVGGRTLGPFAGAARAVAINTAEQFQRQARLAQPAMTEAGAPAALAHLLRVEREVARAAVHLSAPARDFATPFPPGAFGAAVRSAAQLIAVEPGVAAIKLGLGGFDTHRGQAPTHGRLLQELAAGISALRAALIELQRWDSTLVLTYSEFGRRAAENRSGGTDHGTAAVHFALGGAVRGGWYGAPPAFERLDANGNLPHAVDYRNVYATVLQRWWGIDAAPVLRGDFQPLDFLRA